MTVNYTDIKILEGILKTHFPNQENFTKSEVLKIVGEFSKGDQYLYNTKKTPTPYKTFKYFVRYCLYRNLANFDSLILITGDKGCLDKNEKIKTDKGIKTLKEFKDGELLTVKAYDFKNNREVKTLAKYFDTGKKEVQKITLSSGKTINATKDHKFFVKRNNKILELPLKEIKEGDLIAVND